LPAPSPLDSPRGDGRADEGDGLENRLRKERQREVVSGRLLDDKDIDRLLTDQLVYRCVVGSRPYGLDESGSDIDRRGIFVAPAPMMWSLQKATEPRAVHRRRSEAEAGRALMSAQASRLTAMTRPSG
jgi:hypothetical protein